MKNTNAAAGILQIRHEKTCRKAQCPHPPSRHPVHQGGSREDVPGQWTCSQCFAPRCWPVRKRCHRCGAARDDLRMLQMGHLVESRHLLQGMCRPQHVGHKLRLLYVRLGQKGGSFLAPEPPPSLLSEKLVKALQLLQSVLTPEDFSKYEKKLVLPKQQKRVKLREREFLGAEKQEQKHLEMIAKHEHNLAQQKTMLESVRSQLAEVRDTVGALRALVSETKKPPINFVVPPFPPSRKPPPPSLPWRLVVSCLPLEVRRIFCRLMLHVQFTLSMILILT